MGREGALNDFCRAIHLKVDVGDELVALLVLGHGKLSAPNAGFLLHFRDIRVVRILRVVWAVLVRVVRIHPVRLVSLVLARVVVSFPVESPWVVIDLQPSASFKGHDTGQVGWWEKPPLPCTGP